MGLSREQETANRLAARARKARGRGGAKKVESEIQPANMTLMHRQAQMKSAGARLAKASIEKIDQFGALLIPETLPGFREAVRILTDHYFNSNVRYSKVDGGIAFGVRKRWARLLDGCRNSWNLNDFGKPGRGSLLDSFA